MRAKKPYHKRTPSKRQIELLCGEAWPDDGRDPRYDPPAQPRQAKGRKTLQLCAQVKRAVEYALAAELDDPVLNDLSVLDVEPLPNSSCLRVTLEWRSETSAAGLTEVHSHLQRAAGKLRCEVATAICRRKVPELAYRIVAR